MAPIVQATRVVKTYQGKVAVPALNGVDLTVDAGEMVAIMGPSGCGKTTLLNCLSGLDRFDAGDVRIEGVSLADMTDRERTDHRARRMGFVFQFCNLIPVLTSAEKVELPLLVSGFSPREARRRALEALEMVGLGRQPHLPVAAADRQDGGCPSAREPVPHGVRLSTAPALAVDDIRIGLTPIRCARRRAATRHQACPRPIGPPRSQQ